MERVGFSRSQDLVSFVFRCTDGLKRRVLSLQYQANCHVWAYSEFLVCLPEQMHVSEERFRTENLWCECSNCPWSFDTCVGWARRHKQFPTEQIPCTKTLYNLLWRGELPITLFELPEILERKQHGKPRISKHLNGKSIENRPDEVNHRNTFGHWESDTVLGRKCKGEGAAFTIVERLTGCYFMLRIEEKTTAAIAFAMEQLRLEFGEHFAEVFRSITTDNGCEFAAFSDMEAYGTDVYFAHLYSSWKRPVNERSNRMLRRFLPKGTSMNSYSNEQMIMFADEINAMPRKRLGYRTAEELFDEQLDIIYST